jgi:hypothetical protein
LFLRNFRKLLPVYQKMVLLMFTTARTWNLAWIFEFMLHKANKRQALLITSAITASHFVVDFTSWNREQKMKWSVYLVLLSRRYVSTYLYNVSVWSIL